MGLGQYLFTSMAWHILLVSDWIWKPFWHLHQVLVYWKKQRNKERNSSKNKKGRALHWPNSVANSSPWVPFWRPFLSAENMTVTVWIYKSTPKVTFCRHIPILLISILTFCQQMLKVHGPSFCAIKTEKRPQDLHLSRQLKSLLSMSLNSKNKSGNNLNKTTKSVQTKKNPYGEGFKHIIF